MDPLTVIAEWHLSIYSKKEDLEKKSQTKQQKKQNSSFKMHGSVPLPWNYSHMALSSGILPFFHILVSL